MECEVTSNFSRSTHGKLFAATFTAVLAFCAAPASAACMSSAGVYCDATEIQAYNGTSTDNYSGSGFSSPGVGDVLQEPGHSFDTDRLVVSLSQNGGTTYLDLKFYTAFNGNDLTARFADVFLGNNISTPASQNIFGYAISVGDQAANGGLDTQGFYDVSAPGSAETSEQIWQSKTGFIYGGTFQGTDGVFRASPVVVSDTAPMMSKFTTSTTQGASGDASFPSLLEVTLSASNSDFNALFSSGLSVFWGTADCGNDAIQAVIPYSVPEPVTLSLFSVGVVGLGAIRRRKKARAA
jgi:hypothetical protein